MAERGTAAGNVRTWARPVFVAAGSLAAGAALAHAHVEAIGMLVLALAVVLLAPLLSRMAVGTFDLLEPVVWVNVALLVMFVVRPAATFAYDELIYRDRFDVRETAALALVVALAGVAALYAGYFGGLGRRLGHSLPALPDRADTGVLVVLAFTLLALAGVSFAAVTGGVSELENFVSPSENVSTAYLYLAPFLSIPAILLLVRAGLVRRDRPLVVAAVVLAAAAAATLAPAGGRLWLMLLVTPLAIYPMLRSGWRPSPLVLGVLTLPALVLMLAMRDVGPTEQTSLRSSAVEAVEHPARAWRELVTGPDTEMFDALAVELQVVPRGLGFDPGHTLTALVAHPIPRSLWPGKPRQSEDLINEFLHSSTGYRAGAAGPAYSILGGLYYDSGFFGVVVGMALIGVAARALFEYWRRNPASDSAQLLYAAALPFFVVLMRGNFQDTLSRALFVVAPIVAGIVIAGQRAAGGS